MGINNEAFPIGIHVWDLSALVRRKKSQEFIDWALSSAVLNSVLKES